MEFQKEELNEILNIFQQESTEIISSMDGKLLMLEKEKNPDIAMQLFRDAHSLKGSARMLGFEDIQNVAHKIEDIISLIKENKLTITANITDTISECLEFISMLINKTVSQKEEFKSPKTAYYIEKLENIASQSYEKDYIDIETGNIEPYKKEFLSKFEQIEQTIQDILYIVSKARKDNDFSKIFELESKISDFSSLLGPIDNEKINSIKNAAQNILTSLDKFRVSDNQAFSFLDVNNCVISFIEVFCDFTDSENIKRKDYYEIIDKKLNTGTIDSDNNKIDVIKFDKIDEIIERLPLLELNTGFYNDITDIVNTTIQKEISETNKEIYTSIKEIINIYKNKNLTLPQDISLGIKEVLNVIKSAKKNDIKEAKTKLNILKTLAEFQNRKTFNKNKHSQKGELSQKDILNSITNTEIKTLRVDSAKLDNLVGQIGELIVSKIKTNEQLSLAKKINNDLLEWQKNFSKMDYYIKYFDKKYLSNPMEKEERDYRKIVAYNKQLCMLSQQHNEQISSIIREMSNLFKQLQESETKLNTTTVEIESMVKNMRVLPLSTIFTLFPRMVHNIARDKNKKIDLIIEGSDITADKTIIEEIKIPLMHIIRNSIDHGIEDVETRKKLNKNPIGKIEINASYKESKIIIDVKDDGKGLDIEKIKAKALEKNLLTKEELNAISDDELTNLIFYPGFSTEDFVTELSGRGLGLDIVNNKISQMQGRIDIFSQLNKGTVVRIILPATVATKKVFIIEENKELFAIETSVIKTIVRVNSDEIFEKDNKSYYIYSGNAIAIYTLCQILNFDNNPRQTDKYTLLIIETESIIFGIIIEKLISDQEIVHKKLAPPLYKVKHISGITTLANGEACLILNVSDIISTITSKKLRSKIMYKTASIKARDNFKYKILIVDDSHTTRILQKNILTNYGYNVSTSTNPKNALEKVKQTKYDLIISDIQMPVMNGFEFILELRKIKNYENIPVIVVSSEPKENHLKEIEQTKIITYIEKNLFKQEELLSYIEKTLNY